MEWFERDKTYERTYGWSWFLKLHGELQKSPLDKEHKWSEILQPLADLLLDNYMNFLPNLIYPIRVGEHSNTAFGLIFPLEYAEGKTSKLCIAERVVINRLGLDHELSELRELIRHNSSGLYLNDQACPLSWEPSGFDFLSPCLQEAALMGRVISEPSQFEAWLRKFLPTLFDSQFDLEPGQVIDRTDGKLVHLDGLNFSRAWSFYSILMSLSEAASIELR